jgi:hypothetical protein
MIKPPTSGANRTGLCWRKPAVNAPFVEASGQTIVGVTGSYFSQQTPGWKTLSRSQRRHFATWHDFLYRRYVEEETPGEYGFSYLPDRQYDEYWFAYCTSRLAREYTLYVGGEYPFPFLSSKQKALSRMQAKLANSSVNLAQAMAERQQTIDLFARKAHQLSQLALDIRHGHLNLAVKRIRDWVGLNPPKGSKLRLPNLKDVKASSKNLSNWWLEYSYGWKPLLSDIYGSCEALANAYYLKKPLEITGSATSNEVRYNYIVGGGNFGLGGVPPIAKWSETSFYSYTEKSRYTLRVLEDEPLLQAMASTGLTNPALLAWELLPYSFVIDWFLPVGNWLQQQEYARGFKFVTGTFSRRRTGTAVVKLTSSRGNLSGAFDLRLSGLERTISLDEKVREVLGNWPYGEFPSFKPQLGIERVTSGIALLTQVFFGDKHPRKPPLI